jgi:hypothetical protein
MECQEFSKLEQGFLAVRRQRAQKIADGKLTPDLEEQLARAELQALYSLLDHRLEHGCQSSTSARKLPASRNLGGIIGPY